MSDRLKGCTVIFTEDIRTGDAEAILNAIRMVKGVALVEPSVSTAQDWIAETRARGKVLDDLRAWLAEQWKR